MTLMKRAHNQSLRSAHGAGRRRLAGASMVAVAALVAACGNSTTEAGTTAVSTTTTASSGVGSEPDDSAAPSSASPDSGSPQSDPAGTNSADRSGADGKLTMNDILASLVQFEVAGPYRAVGDSETVQGGRGSGFVISADGLAVTNNHVVNGASFIEVFVGGDKQARPAKIVGVSECDDLALVDIDGEGFTPISWSRTDPEPGLEVFAAGFPLGDPEPTLTRGVISKAKADGDRTWASVASTVEHDANIQPGNSGGPLLTTSGEVIAVNYSGGDSRGTGTNQFWAISASLAEPIVESLKKADNLAIGINPEAFVTEDGIAGVWVQSVTDGSPAAEVGLKPGDIITTLKGLPVGTDGSMSDFCKILRSANEGVALSLEAVRLDTGEILEGEMYGREFEVVGNL
jgi:serine protease Do